MKKIKAALIGLNRYSHAMDIFYCVQKLGDMFELAGYVLPENEREKFPDLVKRLEGFPELTLEEVLNNPEIEAVLVETEEIHLTKYALLAAQHGKHIHMEKPGGTDEKLFEKMMAAVKAGGKVFHTGYMYRYNPYVQSLLEQVRNGELGEILSVEAQMNCYHPASTRQWLENFPGGMMFFLGCHLIDLILQLQGMPEEIIPLNCSTGAEGVTAEDFGMAVLKYPHGVSFAKTSAMETGGFARRQLVVSGTKKTVEIYPLERYEGSLMFTEKTEYSVHENWNDQGENSRSELFDRYLAMMASFAAMVRGEKENPWTYEYEEMLYHTMLRCCGR